jgi:large subunit ribosomal protein L6
MSRIGEKPILIPTGVEIKKDRNTVSVKGPLGELKREFLSDIGIEIGKDKVVLTKKKSSPFLNALWGTYASHIRNMIKGVTEGFKKQLVIEGVGYKADLSGNDLVLSLGFSHPLKISAPEGLKISVEKNSIIVSGIDKESVGQMAAKIRSFKKPEPYKGKGIRYENEVVRRKVGKKAATAA